MAKEGGETLNDLKVSGELEALDDGEKVDLDSSDSDSVSLTSEYFSVLIFIPHSGERM